MGASVDRDLTSSFAFATCQVGAERALKEELARRAPKLRPAFMRPGFLTFKSDAPLSLARDLDLDLVLARVFGLSLDRASTGDVVARAGALAKAHGPLRVHVWERDKHAPGDSPGDSPGADGAGGGDGNSHAAATALSAQLALACVDDLLRGTEAAVGDRVLDVIGVDDDVWFLGAHVHRAHTSPSPGADPRLIIPADSPSRAWAKIEQAIHAFDLPIHDGDSVVEVGASPGGVTHALLARGCRVTAIDPAEMDARLSASAHFAHVKLPIADVLPSSLVRPLRWLVLDINISPFAALRQVEALVRDRASELYGLVLTLKLGEWHMAQRIPHLVSIVRKLGAPLVEVHARQLPANKVEVCVAGLTAAGVARRLGRV